MSEELIRLRLRLAGAREAARDTQRVTRSVSGLGLAGKTAGVGLTAMHKGALLAGRGAMFAARWVKRGAMAVGLFAAVEIPRMINAYRESWKIGSKVAQQIRTTGRIANVTAADVENLASSLSLKTGIDDEQIQAASSLLLTFPKIRNEVGKNNDIFNQATRTALDMAAAYDMDLGSATKSLAKALQDPGTMASALKKSGAIDEAGVERLERMAEAGASVIDMQKTLLGSVNKAGVRGAAGAEADPFDHLQVSFENIEEAGGKLLFPFLSKAANKTARFFNQMQNGRGAGGDFVDFLGDVKAKGSDAFDWLKGGIRTVGRFIRRLRSGRGEIGRTGDDLWDMALIARDTAFAIVGYFKTAIPGAIRAIRGVAQVFKGVVNVVGGIVRGDWQRIWDGFADIAQGGLRTVSGLISALALPFRIVFGGVVGWAINKFTGAFDWMAEKIAWFVDRVADVTAMLPGQSFDGRAIVDQVVNDPRHQAATGAGRSGDGGDGSRRPRSRNERAAVKKLTWRPPGGGDRVIQIEVPVNLDGAEVARIVAEHAEDQAARLGLAAA